MVMYRDFAVRHGRKLGIVGNVHNEPDGTVALIGEGEEEKLRSFIEELKEGSLFSRVDQVVVVWKESTGEFSEFTLHY